MSKIWEFFDTMEEIWYYNPFLERQVMLKDTLVEADGKEYRMELAIDSDRQELLDKLKEMSYRDQLTQIGNRHAMNEYIDNLQKEQSLGIVTTAPPSSTRRRPRGQASASRTTPGRSPAGPASSSPSSRWSGAQGSGSSRRWGTG